MTEAEGAEEAVLVVVVVAKMQKMQKMQNHNIPLNRYIFVFRASLEDMRLEIVCGWREFETRVNCIEHYKRYFKKYLFLYILPYYHIVIFTVKRIWNKCFRCFFVWPGGVVGCLSRWSRLLSLLVLSRELQVLSQHGKRVSELRGDEMR